MEHQNKLIINALTDFTRWLERNHLTEKAVSLILYKRHTGKHAPTHRELMEEAICFGWIDTTIHRVDNDTYIRRFARRSKNSKWSTNTLSYAKKLLQEGRLKKEGKEFYEAGKKKPTNDHGIPKNPDMPELLKKAFEKNKKAATAFAKLSPSRKRMLYRWILGGKQEETRKKRSARIVASSVGNSWTASHLPAD